MVDICRIQGFFKLIQTGELNDITMAAIRNYQLKNGLEPTGIPSELIYSHIFGNQTDDIGDSITTDLSEISEPDIIKHHMPTSQYFQTETAKEYIFLHHTAGWSSPTTTIDAWSSDNRGRIATKYVIGGINIKSGDVKDDGVIVEAFPENGYAWHLGAVDNYMHSHSVGIEICNFGWLTRKGVNYYTYVNTLVDPRYVVDLGYEFRGYRYWHKYTDKQIESVKKLLQFLCRKHDIHIKSGIISRLNSMKPALALEYYETSKDGKDKGILSHTSVRKDKFDISPQINIIQMLKSF